MALFRRFFYRKPPDRLLEISERVYVFDCCFSTDVLEEDEYKVYLGNIVTQLQEYYPDASFMVFNFGEGKNRSPISDILSQHSMTVKNYPRDHEGCPMLTLETIHDFLKLSESCLSSEEQQNVVLMHCESGGWPVLAFMLAGLLLYMKQFSGEHKTLEMVYKQAPKQLLHILSPLNPQPSQLRYLQYISRRNIESEWPPKDEPLLLECLILRSLPIFEGRKGCRPVVRVYAQDPFSPSNNTSKLLYSTTKAKRKIRHYTQEECMVMKIDVHCRIQGDVVLECVHLDDDLVHEKMMFRIVFHSSFVRSNILMLSREEIDHPWDMKDQFSKDFRAEVLFMDADAVLANLNTDKVGEDGNETDIASPDEFFEVQEIFSNVMEGIGEVVEGGSVETLTDGPPDPHSFVDCGSDDGKVKDIVVDDVKYKEDVGLNFVKDISIDVGNIKFDQVVVRHEDETEDVKNEVLPVEEKKLVEKLAVQATRKQPSSVKVKASGSRGKQAKPNAVLRWIPNNRGSPNNSMHVTYPRFKHNSAPSTPTVTSPRGSTVGLKPKFRSSTSTDELDKYGSSTPRSFSRKADSAPETLQKTNFSLKPPPPPRELPPSPPQEPPPPPSQEPPPPPQLQETSPPPQEPLAPPEELSVPPEEPPAPPEEPSLPPEELSVPPEEPPSPPEEPPLPPEELSVPPEEPPPPPPEEDPLPEDLLLPPQELPPPPPPRELPPLHQAPPPPPRPPPPPPPPPQASIALPSAPAPAPPPPPPLVPQASKALPSRPPPPPPPVRESSGAVLSPVPPPPPWKAAFMLTAHNNTVGSSASQSAPLQMLPSPSNFMNLMLRVEFGPTGEGSCQPHFHISMPQQPLTEPIAFPGPEAATPPPPLQPPPISVTLSPPPPAMVLTQPPPPQPQPPPPTMVPTQPPQPLPVLPTQPPPPPPLAPPSLIAPLSFSHGPPPPPPPPPPPSSPPSPLPPSSLDGVLPSPPPPPPTQGDHPPPPPPPPPLPPPLPYEASEAPPPPPTFGDPPPPPPLPFLPDNAPSLAPAPPPPPSQSHGVPPPPPPPYGRSPPPPAPPSGVPPPPPPLSGAPPPPPLPGGAPPPPPVPWGAPPPPPPPGGAPPPPPPPGGAPPPPPPPGGAPPPPPPPGGAPPPPPPPGGAPLPPPPPGGAPLPPGPPGAPRPPGGPPPPPGARGPGPPGPPGPPGRGRGLGRPTGPATKKSSLKPYHWSKLTRALQGSLWDELQKYGETQTASDFDVTELEKLFPAHVPKPADKGPKKKAAGSKPEKVTLVDLRRANNTEIMLTKVKMSLSEMMDAALAMDETLLDVDQVENLIKFCPTKEEMDLLRNYTGDKTNLGKCEQFFLELMKVPRVESKLRVFSFKIQFGTQITEFRKNLETVNTACDEVRKSSKLKEILKKILFLGNIMNQGTARGAAIGFKLDSLLKLTDTRATNNRMTLMHFLCKKLEDRTPDLLDFHKDLTSLEVASKIQLKSLAEEMQAIIKGLEKLKQELVASESDGPVSEVFRKTLKGFIGNAESEVVSLTNLYATVGRNADGLVLYFNEDPARCPFEQVMATLLNFVKLFRKAQEENLKAAEQEKKKAEKDAEMEKAKAKEAEEEKAKAKDAEIEKAKGKDAEVEAKDAEMEKDKASDPKIEKAKAKDAEIEKDKASDPKKDGDGEK